MLTCDHIGCHAVSNEHHQVLRLPLSSDIPYRPHSCGLETIVIGQRSSILSRCSKLDVSIRFGRDFDLRRSSCSLSK